LVDQVVRIQASISQLPPNKREYYQAVFNQLEVGLAPYLSLMQSKIDAEYPDLEPLSIK
jgi:hypothetical protein